MEAVWGSRDPRTREARTRLLQHTTDLFKRNVFMCTPTTLIHHIGFLKKGKWNTEEPSFIWRDLQRSEELQYLWDRNRTDKSAGLTLQSAFLVHPEMEIWDGAGPTAEGGWNLFKATICLEQIISSLSHYGTVMSCAYSYWSNRVEYPSTMNP